MDLVPVRICCAVRLTFAVPAGALLLAGIHHSNLGIFLKEKMDALSIECVLRHKDDGGSATATEIAFLQTNFGLNGRKSP